MLGMTFSDSSTGSILVETTGKKRIVHAMLKGPIVATTRPPYATAEDGASLEGERTAVEADKLAEFTAAAQQADLVRARQAAGVCTICGEPPDDCACVREGGGLMGEQQGSVLLTTSEKIANQAGTMEVSAAHRWPANRLRALWWVAGGRVDDDSRAFLNVIKTEVVLGSLTAVATDGRSIRVAKMRAGRYVQGERLLDGGAVPAERHGVASCGMRTVPGLEPVPPPGQRARVRVVCVAPLRWRPRPFRPGLHAGGSVLPQGCGRAGTPDLRGDRCKAGGRSVRSRHRHPVGGQLPSDHPSHKSGGVPGTLHA